MYHANYVNPVFVFLVLVQKYMNRILWNQEHNFRFLKKSFTFTFISELRNKGCDPLSFLQSQGKHIFLPLEFTRQNKLSNNMKTRVNT